jgi:cold shock CspA family protein
MKGLINRYLTDKRYGFILPDAGGDQVFFHQSVFDPGKDGPPPITGEPVEYLQGDNTRAASVLRLIQPDHHVGTVKSYDPVKGYGFIITMTSGQFYLHKSEVIGGLIPAIGSRVDFYTSGNTIPGKSPRACYVAVLQ